MPTLYLKLEIPEDVGHVRDLLDGGSISLFWEKGDDSPKLLAELPNDVRAEVPGAVLTFPLNSSDDAGELRNALDGTTWQCMVWQLLELQLRPMYKWADDVTKAAIAEEISTWIREQIVENNLRLPR